MFVIESINQKYTGACPYAFPQDVKNLLHYIAKPNATEYPPQSCRYLVGAIPDIILADQPEAWERAFHLFNHQLQLFPKQGSLMQHRVISFSGGDIQDPILAFWLAKKVSEFYFKRGYISFFGVHMDTGNLHIHIAVSTTNWRVGSHFFIYDELSLLHNGVDMWYQNYICGKNLPQAQSTFTNNLEG